MADVERKDQEAAWLLHHRPFRNTSRIIDVLTREHGRLALVARGSRAARSKLKGILRPFMPLSISWVARSELGTLTGAEPGGRPLVLEGDALLSGYYVNELLMNLLHRHDPQPEVFDVYTETVTRLAAGEAVAAELRAFELELLRLLGYALEFSRETASQELLEPAGCYEYRSAEGPVRVPDRDGPMVFSGAELLAIGRRDFADASVLRSANRLLRGVIAYHLDGKELKSRKVLREIRRAATRTTK